MRVAFPKSDRFGASARCFARSLATQPPPASSSSDSLPKKGRQQRLGLNPRPGGLPEWLELWGRKPFYRLGAALGASSLALATAAWSDIISPILPVIVSASTFYYWRIGLADMRAKSHTLRQNFPFIIHARYLLEGIRPEIQQYLIEDELQAAPYSRAMRSSIYQRAKSRENSQGFGTRHDVYARGHEWAVHSLWPKPTLSLDEARILIGGPYCSQPYRASLLNISAMSYGALSHAAIEALNKAAAAGKFYHNTGEGGISKYHLQGGADLVWNVGTGYFACGSTGADGKRQFDPAQFEENAHRPTVKMIELKLSQGAKPSHGGILPASKITQAIADARGLGPPPWTHDVVSPPSHSAFSTPCEMMSFLQRLRDLSGGKPVGFKLCVGQPGEIAALCHAMILTEITPDFITIDGSEGGTGAAPSEFQDSLGMPMRDGLRLVNTFLIGAGLRDQIKLIASGKIYNGFSLVSTLANGADLCNSARSMMFALGCIQSLKCNTNKCPTGITTQDPSLIAGLDVPSKAERVENYHAATVHSALEIIGAIGCSSPSQITPQKLYRNSSDSVESFADNYSRKMGGALEAGSLLSKEAIIHSPIREWWEEGRQLNEVLSSKKTGTGTGFTPVRHASR